MFCFFTQITSLSSTDTKTSQMKQPFLPLSEANPLAQAVLTSPTSMQSASSVMPCAPGSGSWLCPSLGTEASFGRTRAPEGISPGPVPQAAPRPRPRQALLARDPTLWLLQRLGIAGTRTPPPTARPRASSEALQASPSGPALRPTAVPLERPLTATHRPPAVLNSCFDNRSGRDRTPGRPCAAAHARTTSWAALWTASDPPAAASAIPESRLPMSRPAGGGRGAEQKQEEGKEK